MREVEASTKPGEVGELVRREGPYSSWLTAQRRELRAQLSHPNEARTELLASVPNQVWSWEITQLTGPAKWICDQLYVIHDIDSRYVMG